MSLHKAYPLRSLADALGISLEACRNGLDEPEAVGALTRERNSTNPAIMHILCTYTKTQPRSDPMPHVTEQDLKDQLTELIDAVANGEEITISRDGQPIAKLTPIAPVNKRKLGFFPIKFTDDLTAPTDQDIIDEFYKD